MRNKEIKELSKIIPKNIKNIILILKYLFFNFFKIKIIFNHYLIIKMRLYSQKKKKLITFVKTKN